MAGGRGLGAPAPVDTFAALGHGGIRALWVIPSKELIVSWNDASVDSPAKQNEALRSLMAAVERGPGDRRGESAPPGAERLRIIIETDAGGDPDDEQSLVRFLLYSNEWDVEGIVANRATVRDVDAIAVLDAGRLDAFGRHDMLLQESAVYGRLWGAQGRSRDWRLYP